MKTYSKRTRKMDGKTFRHTGRSFSHKSEAQTNARRLRAKGYTARVVKEGRTYSLWRGPKKR